MSDLRDLALAWADADPDEACRAELLLLLERGDEAELADRLAGTLAFGTAGLRGVLGAGPNRMNRAVIIRATAGLCAHAIAAVPDAARRGIVVGYDARRMSRQLAHEAARVIAAAGIRVHLFADIVPTPLVSFAVVHLGAAAGVMVTASHNPAPYNGYKVYWDDGAQIVTPTDLQIAAAIDRAPGARDVPRVSEDDPLVSIVGGRVVDAYFAGLRPCRRRAPVRIVYTPLHGVGWAFASRALRAAGFVDVVPVPEQVEPDGSFPTTPFPNPEEPGVLALAMALAERERADLVIANDPDADRTAIAVPDRDGRFVQLTGNQVGVLLAHHLLNAGAEPGERIAGATCRGEPGEPGSPRTGVHCSPAAAGGGGRFVVSTIVSSPMLGDIARAAGAGYEQTLTGFKWLERRAIEVEKATGAKLVLAYEEALGYAVGDHVRDKDGIGAGLAFADLASTCRSEGVSVLDRLDGLYRQHGLYASAQHNLHRVGPAGLRELADMMRRLRAAFPERVAGRRVVAVSDYLAGERCESAWQRDETRVPNDRDGGAQPGDGGGEVRSLGLPASDVVGLELEGGTRIVVRPSGTEPKLKVYLDHREPVRDGEPVTDAARRARAALDEVGRATLDLLGEGR
jgi:phosphomannomutase